MKKLFATFLTGILVFALAFSAGCTGETLYPTYEDGFFVYYKPPKGEYVDIVGLTELGHQQKIIVVPETIGGYKYRICDSRGWGKKAARWGENNTLEKIYFQKTVYWSLDEEYSSLTLEGFSCLKKVFYNSSIVRGISSVNPSYMLYSFIDNYDPDIYTTLYETYKEVNEKITFIHKYIVNPANIEYLYNYEGAPNEGYYWIDDIDDGEKIEIIPSDPKREGYVFDGWYCEPECVNEWDFNREIEKPELIATKDKDIYMYYGEFVNFIYAKWIEN